VYCSHIGLTVRRFPQVHLLFATACPHQEARIDPNKPDLCHIGGYDITETGAVSNPNQLPLAEYSTTRGHSIEMLIFA